jgi:hypothetical protein
MKSVKACVHGEKDVFLAKIVLHVKVSRASLDSFVIVGAGDIDQEFINSSK